MKRILLSLVAASTLFGAAGSAHAVANHKIEAVQKIIKADRIWGARVHLLVDPETYTKFRINVAPKEQVSAEVKKNDMQHRKALANATRGFVLKTLKEKRDTSGMQELYVDIRYGKGLRAGKSVNVLSAYTNGPDGFVAKSSVHMHIFGAWDGPMNQGDEAYVIQLPGLNSEVPRATKTLAVATQ